MPQRPVRAAYNGGSNMGGGFIEFLFSDGQSGNARYAQPQYDARPLYAPQRVPMPPDERQLYNGLTDFIHDELDQDPEARHLRLVLATLQRELTSSPQAVARTLQKLARDPNRDASTRRMLERYLDLAEAIPVSRKARAAE